MNFCFDIEISLYYSYHFYLFIIVEVFTTCGVIVENDPLIATTSIGTYGVSSCYFYLLCGTFKDDPFCYLNHNVDRYENETISNALYLILDDIVTVFKKKFCDTSIDISDNINSTYLFVVGGELLITGYCLPIMFVIGQY